MVFFRSIKAFLLLSSPIFLALFFEHNIGLSWGAIHWKLDSMQVRCTSFNIRAGLFSPLKVSIQNLEVLWDDVEKISQDIQEVRTISQKALIERYPLLWYGLTSVDFVIPHMTVQNQYFCDNLHMRFLCDQKYDYIDCLSLEFDRCFDSNSGLTVRGFHQKNCMQLDLLNRKGFIQFREPIACQSATEKESWFMTAEGEVQSECFEIMGVINSDLLIGTSPLEYQVHNYQIVFTGQPGNAMTFEWQSNRWVGEGSWKESYAPIFLEDSRLDLNISHIEYVPDKERVILDCTINNDQNWAEGQGIWDLQKTCGNIDFSQIHLKNAFNFSGSGRCSYADENLEGEWNGAWDDLAQDQRREITVSLHNQELRIVHKDPVEESMDWLEGVVKIDPQDGNLVFTLHGVSDMGAWTGTWNTQSEEYAIYLGRAQGFPIYAQGQMSISPSNITVKKSFFSTNHMHLNAYEWQGQWQANSREYFLEAVDPQGFLPAIRIDGQGLNGQASWYEQEFEVNIKGALLSGKFINTQNGLQGTIAHIYVDRLREICSVHDADTMAWQEAWLRDPYPIFASPWSLTFCAEKVFWNQQEFHNVFVEHDYYPESIEHRWNMRYRDGSGCFREYWDNNIWKHEATLILSSSTPIDPGLKDGLWTISLYHDAQVDQNIIWHLRAEDIFAEKWQNSIFTSLNILSGRAFSLNQTRSLLEDGIVIEKVRGRGKIAHDAVSIDALEVQAGAITVQAQGFYYPSIDDFQVDLLLRPRLSQALSSLATILSPWSAGVAWVGFKSIGKEVDTWNEQMYHLRGSLDHWEIIPWEPEVLSMPLNT